LNTFRDGRANGGIKPAGGDAQLAQNFGAEILARLVGSVGHQDVVTLFDKCQDGICHGGRAAGEQGTPRTAFQLAHGYAAEKDRIKPDYTGRQGPARQ
jgi:hypothetical protein